jgi:hypothetical protein
MNGFDPKKQRRFRNLLLDKRFQLKYTLAVVVITGALSIVLGFFLYRSQQETSQVALVGLDEDVKASISEELDAEDHKVLFTLVACLGGMVLAMTFLGIVATHKIAGPAFAVRRNLSRIADGELPQVRALRPGDELQSVGEELQRMVGTLRAREQRDVELLANAILALSTTSSAPDPSLLESLKAVHKEKHERLADTVR